MKPMDLKKKRHTKVPKKKRYTKLKRSLCNTYKATSQALFETKSEMYNFHTNCCFQL